MKYKMTSIISIFDKLKYNKDVRILIIGENVILAGIIMILYSFIDILLKSNPILVWVKVFSILLIACNAYYRLNKFALN